MHTIPNPHSLRLSKTAIQGYKERKVLVYSIRRRIMKVGLAAVFEWIDWVILKIEISALRKGVGDLLRSLSPK
jgi:hypothetical protein